MSTLETQEFRPELNVTPFYFRISAVKQEFHFEEDSYYTEDEYVEEGEEEEEEEDVSSTPEQGSKKKARGRAHGEPRMKMRRIFRITHGRERQRGEVTLLHRPRWLLAVPRPSSSSLPHQSKTRTGSCSATRRYWPRTSG